MINQIEALKRPNGETISIDGKPLIEYLNVHGADDVIVRREVINDSEGHIEGTLITFIINPDSPKIQEALPTEPPLKLGPDSYGGNEYELATALALLADKDFAKTIHLRRVTTRLSQIQDTIGKAISTMTSDE
ncbi:MAG: hypothetical protein ABSD69_00150 [Candidatus Levyibacteriota bacterium]|jgi:hypothetical protein